MSLLLIFPFTIPFFLNVFFGYPVVLTHRRMFSKSLLFAAGAPDHLDQRFGSFEDLLEGVE